MNFFYAQKNEKKMVSTSGKSIKEEKLNCNDLETKLSKGVTSLTSTTVLKSASNNIKSVPVNGNKVNC